MKVIEKKFDDRKQWLEWRHKGIGSSDAPALTGDSRFKTKEKLVLEKLQPVNDSEETNYILERGKATEIAARALMNEKFSFSQFEPINFESVDFPFVRASLDGWNGEHFIEIKLLANVKPDQEKDTPGLVKWREAYQKGIIPGEYLPQILHQQLITGKPGIFVGVRCVKGQKIGWDDLAIVKTEYMPQATKKLLLLECEAWFDILNNTYKGELG